MDIAKVIKDIRKKKNWDQEHLAQHLGTTQQTISNWETGAMPRAHMLRKLSALMQETGMGPLAIRTIATAGEPMEKAATKPVLVVLKTLKPIDQLLSLAASRGLSVIVSTDPGEAASLIDKITDK